MSSQAGGTLGDLVQRAHAAGRKAYAVATTLEEARSAGAAGADAVIAEGHEAGGWIGDERSFVLLQRLLDASRPVWAGIGLHRQRRPTWQVPPASCSTASCCSRFWRHVRRGRGP
jgi:NAD(P)H-dependent flavin oxidoreductase YrpB (nitropropane dioxygenase family)